MNSRNYTQNEQNAIASTRRRVERLASFFVDNVPPETDTPNDWLCYLAKFKDELGNINNDVSFFATLLAKAYLIDVLDVCSFDAAAKAQGAPGLDIDEKTIRGERVIAEIKTTHPYKKDDLGAQQAFTFKKDASKLQEEKAEHKFFFVTDRATFDVLKKKKYRQMFQGVKVVFLPFGEEIE